MNITIVTFSWPPRNSIAAHRPYSWAKYWSRAGANVTVLTAKKYEFDAPLDLNLPALPGVRVVEVPYLTAGSASATALFRGALRGPLKRLRAFIRQRFGLSVNPRAGWLNAAIAASKDLARDSNVVVSTYDPRETHLIAWAMKQANPKLKWVADYRDLWSQNHLSGLSGNALAAARAEEMASVGVGADALTSISADLTQALSSWLKKPAFVITNGFDLDVAELDANLSATSFTPNSPIRIVYTGLINLKHRDPRPLLETIQAMERDGAIKPGQVRVEFYGIRNEEAIRLLTGAEYSGVVKVVDHIPRDQALRTQREADLLLLLESGDPEAKGVLTGKVFEYMAAGRPILSLGSVPGSAIHDLIGECGAGVCAGDSRQVMRDTILGALREGRPSWYRPSRAAILQYSREAQAMTMLRDVVGYQPS